MVRDRIHQLTDPNEALQLLKEGNKRFVCNLSEETTCQDEIVHSLIDGQYPFAVILTCSDSRVAPEVLFNQNLGDLFVIRVAGNVASAEVLGSIQYAVLHLHTPLIVVMGHTHCGAIKAACSDEKAPVEVESILKYIEPAVKEKGKDHPEEVSLANVNNMVEIIKNNPTIKNTNVEVKKASYDIETGEVIWYED